MAFFHVSTGGSVIIVIQARVFSFRQAIFHKYHQRHYIAKSAGQQCHLRIFPLKARSKCPGDYLQKNSAMRNGIFRRSVYARNTPRATKKAVREYIPFSIGPAQEIRPRNRRFSRIKVTMAYRIQQKTMGFQENAPKKSPSRKLCTQWVPPQVAHLAPTRVHLQGFPPSSITCSSHLHRK